MARQLFGGSAADVAEDIDGSRVAGATGTVWDGSDSTAHQVTDMTTLEGLPLPELISDSQGMIRQFYGPDGAQNLWVDFGEERIILTPTDLGVQLAAHEADEDAHGLKEWVESVLVSQPDSAWIRKSNLPECFKPNKITPESVRISTVQTNTPTDGYIKYAPAGVALTGTDRTGPFTILGGADVSIGAAWPDVQFILPKTLYPNTYGSSQTTWGVQFTTDAQTVQWMTKFVNAAATFYRVWVDGRRYTVKAVPVKGTDAGYEQMTTLTFVSKKIRTIRIDLETAPFGGVFLPPGTSIWAAPIKGRRLLVLGDSISGGSSGNTAWGSGTWVAQIGDYLGTDDIWNQSRGGTGFVNPGAYTTFQNRLAADVYPHNPDALVIFGGYNDFGYNITDITAAINLLFAGVKANLPNCQVFTIGSFSSSTPAAPGLMAINSAMRTAASSQGFAYGDPHTGACYAPNGALIATHGPWITGTGKKGSPVGDGNADKYIAADGIHPTDAGHTYLAERIADYIREVVRP